MKDTNQDMGWLILFFIASGFSGFFVSSWIVEDNIQAQLFVGTIFMIIFFFVFIALYFLHQKKDKKVILQHAMDRGNYQEVYSQIDSDGKEMKEFWELKMIAAFHCGAIREFQRLYQNYMNEINEATNLNRYVIAILHDLLIASETSKKPVSFMKNLQQPSQKYRNATEYQIVRNLRMGLQEFYKPQKNLVKVYFEKYVMQVEVISKPLRFYLYYVMTLAMNHGDHPQVHDYYKKTMDHVFDDASLQQSEQLKNWIMQKQKGIGNQDNMDNDFNNRRSPFVSNATDDELKRTFTYHQPSRRNPQMEQNNRFTTPAQEMNDYQQEFDTMNAMQQEEPFHLYEADQNDPFATSSSSFHESPTMSHDDFSEASDLDPTWFARRSASASQATNQNNVAFQQPTTPHIQKSAPIEPMQPDPFLRSHSHQNNEEMQSTADNRLNFNMRRNEEPSFVNQRATQRTPFPTTPQTNPMAQPSGENPFGNLRQEQRVQPRQQMHANTQPALDAFAQPQDFQAHPQDFQTQPTMQQPLRQPYQGQAPFANERTQLHRATTPTMEQMNTPQQPDRFSRFQQPDASNPSTQQEDRKPQVSLQSEEPLKNKRFSRKKKQADPFDFSSSQTAQSQVEAQPVEKMERRRAKSEQKEKVTRVQTYETNDYGTYVKHNLIIFFLTLMDAAVICVATSSFVYTAFFTKYSSITSQIIPDIILLAGILAIAVTYLTAGVHTGYTMMKKSTCNWSRSVKVITFPIMLIVYLLIGAICEIPYFIFASIKSKQEI